MGRTERAHTLARSLPICVIQFSVLWSHVLLVAWHPYGLFTLLSPILRTPDLCKAVGPLPDPTPNPPDS